MGSDRLYAADSNLKNSFRDKKKQKWGILTESEMIELYPYGNYKVIGDLYKMKKEKAAYLLSKEDQNAYVAPYRGKPARNEYVVGYIPLEEDDAFVRVIRKKHTGLLGVLIVLTLLVMIFLGGLWLGQKNGAIDEPVEIKSGEMTNPNPQNIRLPGIEKIYADAGDTHVNQLLLNVEGNAYNLQYTITLEDTGEEIYKSKVIPPGHGVREFNMTRSFEAGEYPIVIVVNSSAMEESDGTENMAYNAGQLEAVLIVE